ncbi:MAG: hypothetical protein IJQ61_00325 [Bacteroidales bacterium]|nr:hypothetical protein [Bacteroidales bacterium]
MKKLALILSLLVLVSCTKQNLFCRVTLQVESEHPMVALTVDNTLAGNYFRNLNTGETYPFPVFVNGKCELSVLKGVYVLAFDGVAAYADGGAHRVRSAQYATMLDAVTLTGDDVTVTLKLLNLQ